MPEKVLRKYGERAIIDFALFEIDGVDFRTDATAVTGDTKIGMDGGTQTDTTNNFVDTGSGYSLTLEATETTAKRLFIAIVDQGTKVWLDDYIMVETYGHTDAQHAFNLGADLSTNTETWNFKSIDIHNTDDIALSVTSDSSAGVELTGGSGTPGYGLHIVGGSGGGAAMFAESAYAHGMDVRGTTVGFEASATSGIGFHCTALNGVGFSAGGFNSIGVRINGNQTQSALLIDHPGPFNTGKAIEIIGGENVPAIKVSCTGTNASALELNGLGSGHAIELAGGTTGNALNISALGNHAIDIGASGTGFDGVHIYSGGGTGLHVEAGPTGTNAMYLKTGGSGNGLSIDANGGHGIRTTSSSGSFNGIYVEGAPTGAGVKIDAGGSTGSALELKSAPFSASHGISITTGASSTGHGIHVVSTGGHGINLAAGGSDGYGIYAKGAGTGPGVRFEGGINGDGMFVKSGNTSGNGLVCEAQGIGIYAYSQDEGNGMYLQAEGDGYSGLYCVGGSPNGHGAEYEGLGTGDGVYTLVDGQPLSYVWELQMARVNGAYLLNTPGVDDLTMYKRDNSTPLTVVNVSPTGRTRVS